MSKRGISSIECLAPNDYTYIVGVNGVTRIEQETINYGDHGISQFNIYKNVGQLDRTVMHRAVAEIRYRQESEVG